MRGSARTLRNTAIGVVAFLLVAFILVVQVIQTNWFRTYVRQKIVTATQEATGGKTEIGSFAFDWRHLRADVTDFTVHGTERPNTPPLLHVSRIAITIRLFTSIRRLWSIAYLGVQQPLVNMIVYEDGTTNLPHPPPKQSASDSPLQTVVDLAVAHFELSGGTLQYNSAPQPLTIQGDNLRVDLTYSVLKQSYQGEVSLQPIYVMEGRRTPVVFTLTVPITLEAGRIAIRNASIRTATSEVTITGFLADLKQPKTSARINGRVSVVDLNQLGQFSLAVDPQSPAAAIFLDADAQVAADTIKVNKLHVALGQSAFDGSGTLRDPQGRGALTFESKFDLAELTKLLKSTRKQTGMVSLDGTARFDKDLLDIKTFHLRGFGSELTGDASLENFDRFRVKGNLRDMNVQAITQRFGLQRLPYDATVSGAIEAQGSLRASSRDIQGRVNLSVAPGRRGIPVTGKIEAEYAAANDIRIRNSYLNLPHTQLKFAGTLQDGVRVDLTSQNLDEVFAAIPASSPPAVRLNGGQVQVSAIIAGSFSDPHITGHAAATRIAIQDRQFDELATDFNASKSGIAVEHGSVRRGPMQAMFAGSAGLADWSPASNQPLSLNANVSNGDVADILALAGQKTTGYSGALTAAVKIAGTIGNPTGSANIQVANGTLQGEAFDRLQAQVDLTDQRVTMPSAFIEQDRSRVNLTADYRHSRDSFTTGHLNAHINGSGVDLSRFHRLQNTGGLVQIDAIIAGDLSPTEFLLASVAGDLSAKGLRYEGQDYGDLTAKASTSGNTVTYNIVSDIAGSRIRADGRTQLLPDYPTNLDATLSNLSIDRALALAKRTDIPAKGTASGTLHLSGTVKDPQGSADLEVTNAVVYDEPIDHLRARVTYLPGSIDVTQVEMTAGPSHVGLTAKFDHPRDNLRQGDLQFQFQNSRLDLARVRNIQLRRPGLSGTVEISGQGKGSLSEAASNRITVRDLTAHIGTTGLALDGKNLGALDLSAATAEGKLNLTLESGLANAAIHGRGSAALSGNYPLNAELTFNDLKWSNLQPLLSGSAPSAFDGTTSGRITVDGPLTDPEQLNASLHLTTLQLRPTKVRPEGGQPLAVQNQGDIAMRLENGVVRVESAHLTGPQTDITVTGTASVRDKALDLRVNANANLGVLRTLNSDVYSSGTVALAASIQGTAQEPLVNGRAELHNASVNYGGLPAGISNANGAVLFNGTTATILNLTGESGGGRLTLTGFVTRQDGLRFAVRANASGVRIRVQQGVSVVTTANINLSGTSGNSVASGTVNIDRLSYLPQTDLGSILARSGPPVQSDSNSSPFLQNMNLDITVRTSAATSVQASIVDNIQADAELRIRGRASQPGIVGTIQMNQGKLAFLGSTYRISSGTISFYDPNRVEPILDITLETQAKGVTVVLSVRGPMDDLKLSYTSDPPLQFEEIVGLLAAGKAPTSDPTLLANQPSEPPQSFEQRGESALVGRALADPLSNRLQRVFGVSQLKIDPSFTSGSQLPQARVTLQQQVASNLVFTYVTALDDPNTQIVRIEWSMTPRWSAIGNRDENGVVSITLQYTRQFH